MYVKYANPVAHPVNNQIFQYDMVFYLEMNFIGTGAMERSNENSVIVIILSFYEPPPKMSHLFTSLFAPIRNASKARMTSSKLQCTTAQQSSLQM